MKIKEFAVERYFAQYEFTAKYLLSSSDCDGYPMEFVLNLASAEEKERWNNLKLGYTETRGSLELREAIQQHYRTIELDEIIVSSPGEANFILMNVVLSKGDHVICMAPMYQSLYEIAKSLETDISFWEPDQQQQDWYYDPAGLEKLIRPETKLIIVNFPHNPTGFSPSRVDYQRIIEIARKHNLILFSDEMYRFLDHNPKETLDSACDLYENAVSLWGTAKTFGLAGLRLGWLTSKNKEILQKVENFKDYLSICNSATSEVLATIALNHMDKFVQPNLQKIRRNLELFSEFHQQNKDLFDFSKPVTGSTAFIKLKIKGTALDFAEKLVKETGIMLLPAETFEYGDKHARIGFGRENFPEVLEIFGNYLASAAH
ncbi:aspartate/methionine/tyrosine aminotransferase [Pedobacter cryoconitis]|uniref:aminotransferase class I/II-fold pyridoxal phosphate-dependent enzyme n=1 Tax=Pedobacter cryoconitis TaxID=188932 RepID=UPI00160C199C|nr:aminotransferase class I/II-fold pyridoxal phosphate-dependent enzyme [Pedobacter cryoconitis]MBB6271726.1 aspartate/methionine/tyrosine aminotransferase [Pedobacter cryoconitis]